MKEHYEQQPPTVIRVSADIWPETLSSIIPGYAEQNSLGLDAIVSVKLFSPSNSWSWYPIGFDGDASFVGLVQGWDEEVGGFNYADFLVYGEGLILRDLDFQPTTLRELLHTRYTSNPEEAYHYDPFRYQEIPLILVEEK